MPQLSVNQLSNVQDQIDADGAETTLDSLRESIENNIDTVLLARNQMDAMVERLRRQVAGLRTALIVLAGANLAALAYLMMISG